jgi:hypothetical protein
MIKSPGSALGEDIGSLVEGNIRKVIENESKKYGFRAVRRTLRNNLGSYHRIDIVVEDLKNNPIILIEPKYLRYKKHNWDSRLVAGHYSLRKTYRSIRKSIAVLAGNWTDNSIYFLKNFGVEVYRIAFSTISDILNEYSVTFSWAEKDKETPERALRTFRALSKEVHEEIGERIVKIIEKDLRYSVKTTLSLDPSEARSIREVEVLIKTKQGEFYVSSFNNVTSAMQYLLRLQKDIPDLKTILGEHDR